MGKMTEDRSQAFPIDSTFATVIILTSVSLAIVSTGFSPGEAAEPQEIQRNADVEDEVRVALLVSQRDGTLQETMHAYRVTKNFSEFRIKGAVTTNGVLETHPGNAFGDRMESIEDKNNVKINIRMTPQTNRTNSSNIDPIVVVDRPNTLGVSSNIIKRPMVIHNNSHLRAGSTMFDLRSTPTRNAINSSRRTVENTSVYPVPPGEEPYHKNPIYNRVMVEALIYE